MAEIKEQESASGGQVIPNTAGQWKMAHCLKGENWSSILLACLVLVSNTGHADSRSPDQSSKSLAAQAGDPTAPLAQMQLTYLYSDDLNNSSGDIKQFTFEPVIPVAPHVLGPYAQIIRPDISYTELPGGESGFGDLGLQHVFVPRHHKWGTLGFGYTATLPTAEHSELGQGKYQLGPAMTMVYYGIENWQVGATVTQSWSVAGDEDREDVSSLTVQPILNYLYRNWYMGIGDFTWNYDWEANGGWTIPLGLQLGNIARIGKYNYNLSVELLWVPVQNGDGPTPERGIKFGFVWLLPE